MEALEYIDPIASNEITKRHLLKALAQNLGAQVSGMDVLDQSDWSDEWEWFDPHLIKTIEEVEELPEHWKRVLKSQNGTCWRLKYKYVHAPEEIVVRYPHVPIKGIFVVTNEQATKETVVAEDLIHLLGEFTEHSHEDSGIWKNWILAED